MLNQKRTVAVKSSFIITLTFILLMFPVFIILAVYLFLGINIFDNPDFWYGYMAYFGTVVLAAVSVWQTKKANDISQRLLEMEFNKNIPCVDIRGITEIELRKSNVADRLNVLVDDCYSVFDDNWNKLHYDGTALFFSMKNLKDTDILNINMIDIRSAVKVKNDFIMEKTHQCANSVTIQTISPGEAIPLVLNIPDDLFEKVAEVSTERDLSASLFLDVSLSMLNSEGRRYMQRIEFNIVNAFNQGIASPVIINKNIIQAIPFEEYKEKRS